MHELPTYQHPLKPLSSIQMRQLLADLNQARVATRKQGGSTLSYLEAWDVRASLIRIFGFGGFSSDLVSSERIAISKDIPALEWNKDRNAPKKQKIDELTNEPVFNFRVTMQATMRLYIHQLGATYTETAISSQTGPDIGEVADFAVKTAESDALKRAAVNLGTQFGMSLYDNGSMSDVIRRVLAPGQRMLDIDYGSLPSAEDEDKKAAIADARAKAAPSAPEQSAAEAETPMALDGAPTEQEQAAAARTMQGGFGA